MRVESSKLTGGLLEATTSKYLEYTQEPPVEVARQSKLERKLGEVYCIGLCYRASEPWLHMYMQYVAPCL